ncbi:glutamine-hydrolyzing GMP synthase [Thermoflexus sp.]|uniref:glutamine-hydrolyzing GMP synthase n=1 Tax=Thermoflexus sp. TaxID=1969742 RepID=UPI002ADD7735|nr:glutamine-hydrolyzing GMP synthase [Thermoflexus sp.]
MIRPNHDALVVLDFGSQYAQLIVRRIRESGVYAELFPWDADPEEVLALRPKGFILSGGPASVYEAGAPTLPTYVLESGRPVLGICYGMQLLAHALGGRVAPAPAREYGRAEIEILTPADPLWHGLPSPMTVWMSHGDRVEALPPGFRAMARSPNAPLAAIGDPERRLYGVQFHPEVAHTPLGRELLRRFALDLCGCRPTWIPPAIAEEQIARIRERVGGERVLCAVSGGVDSTVTAALVHRAVGDRLTCLFVDTGLLRQGEAEAVVRALRGLGLPIVAVHAAETFLEALRGITDPEEKRVRIGHAFIAVFTEHARRLGPFRFLAQGTLYPDVIESRGPERRAAARIKTHHNVGGLPPDLSFELIEPLRYLFKDEARALGAHLGLPAELLRRQPFPGPGLAVRCVGEVTWERLERLRAADAIVQEELAHSGWADRVAQAFAVLLPVRSVGVMGDARTYEEVVAIRAVATEDFMTASWVPLPHEILDRIATRIVNEVPGVNRVLYDITHKPPATIEWE